MTMQVSVVLQLTMAAALSSGGPAPQRGVIYLSGAFAAQRAHLGRITKLARAALAGCVGLVMPAFASDAGTFRAKDAPRACQLVMAADADIEQWCQCVAAVGDEHPANAVLLDCASAITWYSQTDGRVAGSKIGECFRTGSPLPTSIE
jgi:hypothetical protein